MEEKKEKKKEDKNVLLWFQLRFLTCMELLIRFAQQKHLRSDVPKVAAAMQRGCRCALAAAKWCATVTQRYTRAAGSVSGKIWRPCAGSVFGRLKR